LITCIAWVHKGIVGSTQFATEAGRGVSSGARVEDGINVRLSGGAEAAGKARRELSKLRADIDPPLMETLRLLVTELVSNSVRHARSQTIVLKVLVGRSAVLTEVTDHGPGFDPENAVEPGAESGWGLFLVERLSHRWGVNHGPDTTRVWFELVRG
jgi:anti-sigma regulatory factor (Ser/Thr protein kinase)